MNKFCIGCIIGLLVGTGISTTGHSYRMDELKAEAVERGLGHYCPVDGKPKFSWEECK